MAVSNSDAPKNSDTPKHRVAARALEFVESGMRLGLGTGSTAAIFVDLLAARVARGLDVICVPTSEATRRQAEGHGLRLTDLDATTALDLTIDGADEFDPQLRLIKGGGGALLREKIVAAASARMIVIADETKAVAALGRFPLPVEVNPFGLGATERLIGEAARRLGLSGPIILRRNAAGEVFTTDGGHLILDCHFGTIPKPEDLSCALLAVPGVVEHGLFLGLASAVVTTDGPSARVIAPGEDAGRGRGRGA